MCPFIIYECYNLDALLTKSIWYSFYYSSQMAWWPKYSSLRMSLLEIVKELENKKKDIGPIGQRKWKRKSWGIAQKLGRTHHFKISRKVMSFLILNVGKEILRNCSKIGKNTSFQDLSQSHVIPRFKCGHSQQWFVTTYIWLMHVALVILMRLQFLSMFYIIKTMCNVLCRSTFLFSTQWCLQMNVTFWYLKLFASDISKGGGSWPNKYVNLLKFLTFTLI